MPKKQKRKAIKKVKSLTKLSSKRLPLVHASKPVLKHFRLVEHKHTGKIIHHKNTSHLALVIILAFIGFFLYACSNIADAAADGSVSVRVLVKGPAPAIGATIISPADDTITVDQDVVEVSGTCQAKTYVVVQGNGLPIGSTNCTAAGIFNLEVQLQLGKNVLIASNYDNVNQSGPVTPSVTISYVKSVVKTDIPVKQVENTIVEGKVLIATKVTEVPVLPGNPSVIKGLDTGTTSECENYNGSSDMPTSSSPYVTIACMPRLFMPGIKQTLGLLVWGGTPPYAVSIDWNNNKSEEDGDEHELIAIEKIGYKTVSFNYAVPSIYNVKVRLKDKNNKVAVVESAIQVSGATTSDSDDDTSTATGSTSGSGSSSGPTSSAIVNAVLDVEWFKTPVPFYLLAVAITLGFWGGDLFDRQFGSGKNKNRKRVA